VFLLTHVLRPFFEAGSCRFIALCADGQYRLCYSPLSAWIADYPEYSTLMQLRYGDCFWCETRSSEAGDYPDQMAPFRDHSLYQRLLLDGKVEELDRRGVLDAENVLWRTGAEVDDLPKPDPLHCIQLGILSHLLDWVVNFLQESQRLKLFDQLWVSIPPYQDMLHSKKSFQEVSSWQGKEIKTMSRFMLACFAASLDNPANNETRESFDEAILCGRAALEFYMYAPYRNYFGLYV
jgi:hypothetical protein